MRQRILLAILVILAAVFAILLICRLGNAQGESVTPSSSPSPTPSVSSTATTTTAPEANGSLGLGLLRGNRAVFVELATGQERELVPSGYEVVSWHAYGWASESLILSKGNELFIYVPGGAAPKPIFSPSGEPLLRKDENASIHSSVTDGGKFLIQIKTFDPEEEPGMAPPTVLAQRTYVYDMTSGKLTRIADIAFAEGPNFGGCFEYDSINSRLFQWPCGEGIGSSAPLSIRELSGKKVREVITQAEFGLKEEDLGPVDIHFHDGRFFAMWKGKQKKIVILDPKPASPTKRTYELTEAAQAPLSEAYPYSVGIDDTTGTIVIGGGYGIYLLRTDGKGTVTASEERKEPELYANFIFIHSGKLYYQAKDGIRIVDLRTWQVDKTLANERGEEIGLFALP